MKPTLFILLLLIGGVSCQHRAYTFKPTGKVYAKYYAIGPAGPMYKWVRIDSANCKIPESIKW